jgi:hypothetical protein
MVFLIFSCTITTRPLGTICAGNRGLHTEEYSRVNTAVIASPLERARSGFLNGCDIIARKNIETDAFKLYNFPHVYILEFLLKHAPD